MDTHDPGLSIALSGLVPMKVLEFYQEQGPGTAEFLAARLYGRVLASEGDKLLYRSAKPDETTRLFNGLVLSLATVAFNIGGVPPVFGQPYNAEDILAKSIGRAAAREYCALVTERYYQQLPPATAFCWLAYPRPRAEPETAFSARGWFEGATPEVLQQLQEQGYSNLGPEGEVLAGAIATRLLQQEAASNAELRSLTRAAQDRGVGVACRVDPAQAVTWQRLYQLALALLQ